MLECLVVEPGDVPDEVGPEPHGERDEWVRQRAGESVPLDFAREVGREPDHCETGCPLGHDNVLEEMCREEVVEGERLEWREKNGEQQELARGERDASRGGGRAPELDEGVNRGQGKNDGGGVPS